MNQELHKAFKSTLETIPLLKAECPEIEIRFGKLNKGNSNNKFDSTLTKEVFDSLLVIFQSNKDWSHTNVTVSTDYFQGNSRLTYVNNSFYSIKKVKLGAMDIEHDDKTNYDMRLSISTETPQEVKDIERSTLNMSNYDTIRKKTRFTFHHKNIWQYDFTVVDTNGEIRYELEIELINPKACIQVFTINYLCDSLICKVNDIGNMVKCINKKD